MSALGSLIVKLGLEYAEYTSGLSKTEQAALATAKKVQDTFDGLQQKVATTVGAIAGGLAAGFAVSAFKNLLSGVIETGARLDDLRMQTGETVEALSALLAVGKYNDVGADQLGAMMQKLSSNLAGATEESKGASKALQALGIDMEAFRRQSPAEQFQEIARKLADFEDGAGKSAVAIALLGKEGANALPFFNDLAAAGELQAKITTEQAAAAANLDDNITRLSTTGDAWKKELVTGMVPALDLGAQALLDVMNGTGGMREEVRKLAADGSIRDWTKAGITGLTYLADGVQYVIRLLKIGGQSIGAYAAAASVSMGSIAQAMRLIARGEFDGAVDALRSGMSGAGDIIKDLGEGVQAAFSEETMGGRIRARMVEIEAVGAVAEAAKPKLDFSNVVEKAGKAAAAAKNPVDALIESIDKRAAHLALELAAEEKLTEGEKAAIDVLEQLRSGKVKVTEAESALIGERLKSMLEQEKAVKRIAEEKQALEALRVERVKVTQGMEQSAAAVLQSNEELEREIELIGLTQAQQADVLRARNEAIILTKEATLAELERRDAITGTMSREQIALAQEIDGLKRRNELLGKKQAREEEFTAWQSMWQSIDQTAHDVFVNVFEDGAGTFKRLGQTLKAAVLDLLYQMTIKRWIISIGASVFGAGTAAAASAGGGAGVLSTVGNIGMLGSLATSPWGSAALGWAGGMGGFGAGFAGAASEAAFGSAFVGPSVSAAGGSIGAGATFAQALPYLGLALGAIALLSGFDKSGTPHYGASATYDGGKVSGDEAAFQANRGISGRYSASAQSGVNAVAMGAGMALDAMDRTFGGKGGYAVTTAYSDDSSDDPGFGSLRITRNGEKVTDWGDTRTSKWADKIFADGAEGAKMYADAVATDVRDAMLDIDLPSWARDLLTEIGDNVSMEQLGQVVQQIGVIKDTFDTLGATLTGFADLTDEARKRILDASGSIDALAANAGTFYQNFYTEGERTDIAKKQVRAQLDALGVDINLDDPEARAKYRELVESQLANIDKEGAPELYAALLKLSGAFAAVTASADDAAEATKRQADADANARRAATDAALQALERAVAAERTAIQARVTAAQERVAQERAIVELTQGHVRELRGQVDTTAAMAVAQAKRFIDDAVGAAGNSGYLPDQAELSRAIDTMRGGMGQESYSSRLAWEEAQLKLALQLETLGESAKDQLTTDEQTLAAAEEQLRYLDDLLTAARVEIDAIRGTTKAVESVTAAIDSLREAILEEKRKEEEAKKEASGGGGGSSSGGGGFAIGGSGPGDSGGGGTYVPPTKSEAIRSQFRGYDPQSTEDLLKAYNASLYFDWTTKDIADAYGVGEEDMRALFEEHGIPAFAGGGSHLGGLRLVGEDGPELEVTGPSRIYNASQTQQLLAGLRSAGNADVVAAIRDLQRLVYDIGRAELVLMQNMETLARKQDAIGVLQREPATV